MPNKNGLNSANATSQAKALRESAIKQAESTMSKYADKEDVFGGESYFSIIDLKFHGVAEEIADKILSLVEKESGWISVADRLPESDDIDEICNGYYDIYTEEYGQLSAMFCGCEWLLKRH